MALASGLPIVTSSNPAIFASFLGLVDPVIGSVRDQAQVAGVNPGVRKFLDKDHQAAPLANDGVGLAELDLPDLVTPLENRLRHRLSHSCLPGVCIHPLSPANSKQIVIPLVFGSDHGEALHESATRFLVIEQVPIDDLAADPANPRHTQTRRWRP